MKKLLYPTILLCCLLLTSLDAQAPFNPPCPTNQEPPADLCGQTCIFCTFSDIFSTTNGYTGQPPANFCGTIENEQWVAFIAGQSFATISAIPSNCATGNGVQLALYPSCDATAPIACNGGANGGGNTPTSITVDLNPGQTYYLMIDGFAGDECDFTLSATPSSALQSPPVGATGDIQGPDVICGSTDVWYQLTNAVDGAGSYTWTAPPGWTINGQPSPVTVSASGVYGAVVNANGNAGGQLCVLPFNACEVGDPVCKDIFLQAGGAVYVDYNANGTRDAGEVPAAGIEVTLSGGQTYLTNDQGLFSLPTSTAGDTLSVINLMNSVGTHPDFHIIGAQPYACYDFGVLPAPGFANGFVYWDLNGDTIYNGADVLAPNRIVKANGQADQITGSVGDFRFSNMSPGDSMWVVLPLIASAAVPDFQVYKDSITGGYDFALIPGPVTVNGYVYYDYNSNGIFDGVDVTQPGVSVYTSSGALVTTNAVGAYELQMVDLGDTVRVMPQGPPSVSNPAFHVVQFQPYGTGNTVNFALSPTFENVDLAIVLSNTGVFRPGFSTTLFATVLNAQGPSSSVEAKIVLPNWLNVENYDPFPTNINGDTLCWNIGAMSPGAEAIIEMTLGTPTDILLGDTVNIQGWVLPLSPDQFPQNNFYLLQRTVVGAYDPNDKQVVPEQIPLTDTTAFDKPLEYTIRFQNTGNFPADFVVLRDTLSADLDLSTFRFLASSHPCTWRVEPGRILVIDFPNINLPDSSSNLLESQGFVKFGVRPRGAFPNGHIFQNAADIFFDFNAPIRTNTAVTKVVDKLIAASSLFLSNEQLTVRPNPAKDRIFIQWETPVKGSAALQLFDVQGKLIKTQRVGEQVRSMEWNIAGAKPGVYFVVLQTKTGRMLCKVVVQ
ncbi:MAG: DUF7619 domain-containing protein [Saprospiraceae bacterium]